MTSLTESEGNRSLRPAAPKLARLLVGNIFVPLLLTVVGLIIEYRSGLFQPSPQPSWLAGWYNYAIVVITAGLLITLFFTKDVITISIRQNRYLREEYSLMALCAIACLTLLVAASLLSGQMPWSIHRPLLAIFRTGNADRSEVRATDYVLLVILYFLAVQVIRQQHQAWRGLKSQDQYRREQRNDPIGLVAEGIGELRRLAKHGAPLEVHSDSSPKQFVQQLDPVIDPLAWKDRAKELVRLSSSSYAFDSESDWHDKENCWVGQNVDTGDLVFLYPSQEKSGAVKPLSQFTHYDYVERIAKERHKGIGEVIVAARGASGEPLEVSSRLKVRYESEDNLLDNLVDFRDYFNEIKRRVLTNALPDSKLTINDVYVPSMYTPEPGEKGCSVEDFLNGWLEESGHRQLALLGEYGQGKSTTALMWAYHIIADGRGGRRIPVLIELRGTSPRNLTPLQLLGAWASQYSINPQALMRLLIAGRIVLILEGFDEMALVGDADMRLRHFRTLWQFAYPGSKILITGRPNFFLDEDEMKAALGISMPIANRPYCEAIRLLPFSPEQIKEALRAYGDLVPSQIYTLAQTNLRFRELVSRPSLLHLVATLWERERLYEKVDRLTSAFVMELFIRHSYTRQGLKEVGSPEFMALTTMEREFFMIGIAAFMVAHDLPNQISASQLNGAIMDMVEAIPDSVSEGSPAIYGESTQPLRNRIGGSERVIEHIKTDVRACGLLVDDPAAPGTFRFGHKSFMEYLFAVVVAERIQTEKPESAMALLSATNARIADISTVPVAVEFLSELLMGAKNDQEPGGRGKGYLVASRIFRNVVAETVFDSVFLSPVVVMAALPAIFPWLSSRAFRKVTILLLALLPLVAGCFAWYVERRFLKPHQLSNPENDLPSKIPVLVGIVLGLSSMLAMKVTESIGGSDSLGRKLRLWIHICKQLGIPDSTLHRVIGTNLIPSALTRQIADLYMDRSEPREGS